MISALFNTSCDEKQIDIFQFPSLGHKLLFVVCEILDKTVVS